MVSLVERTAAGVDLHKLPAAGQTPHIKTVFQRHAEGGGDGSADRCAGVEKLNAALQAVQQPPAPQPVPPLPEMAQMVSGQTFELATNPIHLASVRLEFDESAEAVMQLAFDDGRPSWTVPVGLDGVYRMYPGENNLPTRTTQALAQTVNLK